MKALVHSLAKSHSLSKSESRRGVSMIEVLIVVALLAVLFIMVLSQVGTNNLKRARDSARKDDLHRVKVAFEEYYNDNNCYPEPGILVNCGSNDLAPYMNIIPCDPLTQEPYVYVPHPNTENHCRGYRVYSPMEWTGDPVIEQLGCQDGCGVDDDLLDYYGVNRWSAEDYQYGVSEGVPVGLPIGSTVITSGYCCESGASCGLFNDAAGGCTGSRHSTEESCLAACTE